jgi:hypothetical protein
MAVFAGHLEDCRQSLQARVRQKDAELLAHDSLPDVRVAVAVRAELVHGVVYMQGA